MLLKYGDINKKLNINEDDIIKFKELNNNIAENLLIGKSINTSNFKSIYKNLDNYLVEIISLGFKVLGENEHFNYEQLFIDNISKYDLKDFLINNTNKSLGQMIQQRELEIKNFNPILDEPILQELEEEIIKEEIFFNRWYIYLASIEFITFYSEMSTLFWGDFNNRLDSKIGTALFSLEKRVGHFLHKLLNNKLNSLIIYRDYLEDLYRHLNFNVYSDNQVYLMDVFFDKLFYFIEFENIFERNLLIDELDKEVKVDKICISEHSNYLFDYPNDFLMEFLFNKESIYRRNLSSIKGEDFDIYLYLLGISSYKDDLKYLLNKVNTKPVIVFHKNPEKVKGFQHPNISKILILDVKCNIMDEKYKIIDYLNNFKK